MSQGLSGFLDEKIMKNNLSINQKPFKNIYLVYCDDKKYVEDSKNIKHHTSFLNLSQFQKHIYLFELPFKSILEAI